LKITITDYGCGIAPEVKDRLFKEIITTKGKDGTGLGLFISYSNLKTQFNGNLSFESELGKGTSFEITLPIMRN
jgi:signal transduction histidine kinase